MKVFAASLIAETNTFSPIPTGMDDFLLVRDIENFLADNNEDDKGPLLVWRKLTERHGGQCVCGLLALGHDAGLTTQTTYEQLRDEILDQLRAAGPVDIVLLELHGAMIAYGYDDCEGDLISRVRQIVGTETIVGVELDLHCHITPAMVAHSDIIITFKEYPHIDVDARARELFTIAVDAHLQSIVPTMAVFDCKMVGIYPTTTPEMQAFVQAMSEAEQQAGVLSVSFAHGFHCGDVVDAGGKILVVTDNNIALAETMAQEFGKKIFSIREKIQFKSMPLEEALPHALSLSSQGKKMPVVVADQSDNAGGGAPSDSTFALAWLLDQGVEDVAIAILYDPQVVKLAKSAGVNAELQIRLGGKMGPTSGNPLDVCVTVADIKNDYKHRFPQDNGEAFFFDLGDTVYLQCQGIDIIVSSKRSQCYSPCVFSDFGIAINDKRLLICKSTQHFYAAFFPIAKDIVYMTTPGAMPFNLRDIPYQKMSTNDKYPWVDNPFANRDTRLTEIGTNE